MAGWNIDHFVGLEAIRDNNNNLCFSGGSIGWVDGRYFNVVYNKNQDKLYYALVDRDASSMAGQPITVTLKYTKTTDSPSTSKIPFEPLVEYSTDEKFIGYWIDGKKLYRKCARFNISSYTDVQKCRTFEIAAHENVSEVANFLTAGKIGSSANYLIGTTFGASNPVLPQYTPYCVITPSDNSCKVMVQCNLDNNTDPTSINGYYVLEYTKAID